MSTVSSSLHIFRAILRIAYVRTSWKSLLLLLAILNTKSIPLAWHFRLAYHFLKNLRLRADRPLILYANDSLDAKERPTHPIFTAASIYSHTGLLETDYNMHKSNSTYFSDLDISRTALMTRIYSPGLTIVSRELDKELQSASMSDKPLKKSSIYIALGSAFCSFKREIKPYERYEIRTQIAAWDEKWVYTLSYFLRPEKKKGEGKTLLAIAISKYVIKKGRLTVPPERVFRASGFLPPRPDGFREQPTVNQLGDGSADISATGTPMSGDGITAEEDFLAQGVLHVSEDQISPPAVLEDQKIKNSKSWDDHEWTWERIDQKRRRGLDIIEGYVKLDTKLHEEWNN